MVRGEGRGGEAGRAHRGDDGALVVRGRAECARHPNADRHQPRADGVRQRAGPRSLQRRVPFGVVVEPLARGDQTRPQQQRSQLSNIRSHPFRSLLFMLLLASPTRRVRYII